MCAAGEQFPLRGEADPRIGSFQGPNAPPFAGQVPDAQTLPSRDCQPPSVLRKGHITELPPKVLGEFALGDGPFERIKLTPELRDYRAPRSVVAKLYGEAIQRQRE